ncbi:MAG: general stress protein [Flavobacterium sp. BFFFF1]|uniref:pyridoxamine 5'-phosphate oxidase family protein n=1 Tax=Flavobacterium sp. BFFFF1 TaxID=2015557 RepID=UPI000BD04D50|nr:pyridoxamine 5'-phosphate oxidase family protein [Flavobacterium sp. BFFFF1]OYU80877.1 MAG: general stress protein [Flavobacterium sp. BFFFF1]
MDSINQQQPEDNFRDLQGAEALQKIKELAKKAGSCFFCTNIVSGKPFQTRPMAAEKIDDQGNFWFLSSNDSHKNEEIASDPHVQMLFQGSSYSDYMTLYGTATISTDRQKIAELWDATMKTWFTEGQDDPRITVIKFVPSEGYYWDTKHNMAIGLLKRTYGAIVGETYDDSIEGNIMP